MLNLEHRWEIKKDISNVKVTIYKESNVYEGTSINLGRAVVLALLRYEYSLS
jgi:hypothetical protein